MQAGHPSRDQREPDALGLKLSARATMAALAAK